MADIFVDAANIIVGEMDIFVEGVPRGDRWCRESRVSGGM
jgi:hypothetical protein